MDEKYAIDKSKVVHDTIEGETIVINLDSGAYYALNHTAGEVWNWIDDGLDKPRIVAMLQQRYTVDEPNVSSALAPFFDKLVLEGLLLANAEAAPSTGGAGIQEQASHGDRQPFLPPEISVFTDMADFLKVDPIHEVDEKGWPHKKTDQVGKAQ